MNKSIKSFIWSLTFILIYFYATTGIVRLFWDCTNKYQFEGRVKYLIYLHIFISFILIIIPYHIFGPYHVNFIYKGIIIYHGLFIFIGITSNILFKIL
jgi:hypothetical protein